MGAESGRAIGRGGEKLFRLFGHQVRRSVWRSFRRPRRRGVRVVKEGLYPEMADRKKKKVGRRTGEGIFVLYRDRRRGDLFWRLDLPSVTTIPPPSFSVVTPNAKKKFSRALIAVTLRWKLLLRRCRLFCFFSSSYIRLCTPPPPFCKTSVCSSVVRRSRGKKEISSELFSPLCFLPTPFCLTSLLPPLE